MDNKNFQNIDEEMSFIGSLFVPHTAGAVCDYYISPVKFTSDICSVIYDAIAIYGNLHIELPDMVTIVDRIARKSHQEYWFAVIGECVNLNDIWLDRKIKELFSNKPYSYYLKSSHWQRIREVALRLADFRCQICNVQEQLHVHHRTYERFGKEKMADLTVLCKKCHLLFHGINAEESKVLEA